MRSQSQFIITERLNFRELTMLDAHALGTMLLDKDVMLYWSRSFTDKDIEAWIQRQLNRYRTDGFGYWLLTHRETGEVIGQAGLMIQEIEDSRIPSVAYMLNKSYWHQGYATEAVRAIITFAFKKLSYRKIYCLIRPENLPSFKLSVNLGFQVEKIVIFYKLEHVLLSLSHGQLIN